LRDEKPSLITQFCCAWDGNTDDADQADDHGYNIHPVLYPGENQSAKIGSVSVSNIPDVEADLFFNFSGNETFIRFHPPQALRNESIDCRGSAAKQ
jgi:hypothetical protein